jgi:hypothetical protein
MDKPDLERPRPAGESDVEGLSGATQPKSWVDELIAMTRPGLDMELPDRAFLPRVPPYGFDDFS